MRINIDFLVAGCNTRCRHCYVNGGPGPLMGLNDALLCLEKLDAAAEFLPGEVSFTLDHEPMNHPEIGRILSAASHARHMENYHHGMTTGVGLMARKDRQAVIQSYLDNGYCQFGITLHGLSAHHDEIVGRKGAFDQAVAAAKFLSRLGCQVQISLMLNRFFSEDADGINRLLDEIGPDDIWLAVPIFTPHLNMTAFEPYRAGLKTFEAVRGSFARWGQNKEEMMKRAFQNSVAGAEKRLETVDLRQLWEGEQEELYLSLHQDCNLYVGNSGAETELIGDLRTLEPERTAELIKRLPGNRDYGAFYDKERLPAVEDIQNALRRLPRDLVYGDFESVLYRAFVELGVPNKLLA